MAPKDEKSLYDNLDALTAGTDVPAAEEDFSLEEIGASEVWKVAEHTFDLHHTPEMFNGNIMTEYEEKFSSQGNPICKLIAARKN